MDFPSLLRHFTDAVEAGDGKALGALFTEDGVYHDTFYGEFRGRAAIAEMLQGNFHRDGEGFLWEMHEAVCQGALGYASWIFSYSGRGLENRGKRAVVEGMSRFRLRDGLIAHYGEVFNSGVALTQLGFAPKRMEKLFQRWAKEQTLEPRLKRHLEGP